MKKLTFIAALVCTFLLLCISGFLGFQYQTLNGRFQTLETQASQLKNNNSELKTKLSDSNEKLEDKEAYLESQNEYISELSRQIDSLAEEEESASSDSEEDSSSKEEENDNDPYPNLYAEGFGSQETENEPEKIAYLTFDDGPSSLTPKVLDLLDEYDAKATFFVVCKNNEEYAEYLSEIVKRGHTLALHSYSHNYNQIYASMDAFLSDYEKVYDWVMENTGYIPSLFRFPGGSNNGSSYVVNEIIDELERRGFQYFDWNVSSGDGSNLTTTENIIDNICNNIGNVKHPVVLMHDGSGKDATLAALPTVLKRLSDKGYEFRSLDKNVPSVHYR
ncbi:hypothetical protein D3Z36_04735 [Lachnospiraceae bacterium]|nr:hypothetical protein [Lachnospiraceae bacterium]